MILKANGKINLNLKIKGKRNDGYHELESLMVPISLYDEIEIKESSFDDCICEGVLKEKNLAYKALKMIKERFSIERCFSIKIKKDLPMCAGLGGGSSDAAFVIKGLNEMLNLRLTNEEMINAALEIGSDVPFFINNEISIAKGRGEVLIKTHINDLYGVLVFDGLEFKTGDVFNRFDNYIEKKLYVDRVNDLELGLSEEEFKRISGIKEKLLENGCYTASMTGSGSSVFGLCESKEEALKVTKKLKDKYLYVRYFENLK